MVAKTQAATLVAPKQFELREYDVPELTPETGLMKVEAVGICGSDVRSYRQPVPVPRIMGHENVGVMAAVGREAAERWG